MSTLLNKKVTLVGTFLIVTKRNIYNKVCNTNKESAMMSKFSERLKKIRDNRKDIDKKWTQKYVADKIGVARETYTGYERGTKTPPFETINRIADLFNVTTDYLTGRSDNPNLNEKENVEFNELEAILESLPEEEKKKVINMIKAYADMTKTKE